MLKSLADGLKVASASRISDQLSAFSFLHSAFSNQPTADALAAPLTTRDFDVAKK
jgi:hypothetical protein